MTSNWSQQQNCTKIDMNDPYTCRIKAGRVTTLKNFLKRLYRMLLAFILSLHTFGMQVLGFFYKILIMQQLPLKIQNFKSIHKTVWPLQSLKNLNFATYNWSLGLFDIENLTFVEDCRNQTVLWIDLKFQILRGNCYIINNL